jgi:hypothetical protein
MGPKSYHAIEVRQQPNSPPMYLIAVRAADLLEWCDVPRTKEDYMAGYQRVLTPARTEDITEYLNESDNNILPGAVIVAADMEYVSVTGSGANIYVEVREDTRDPRTKLEELFGAFTTRLSDEELRSAKVSVLYSGEKEANAEDESEYPVSYIAALAQELNQALQDWSAVDESRQKAIEDFIIGVSKPGLIIDGQHRVIGAKNVSKHDVMLPCVILPGLKHEEQVFQFYVLNSKAKPLKPTELRRIISTSLTNNEIAGLYDRFRTAKVDAWEARWTYEMNTSPKSVFKELVDFGFGLQGTVIPENVADQLIRAFVKMPKNRYSALLNSIEPRWSVPTERLEIFFDFWKAVSEIYVDIWAAAVKAAKQGEQSQLFMKVSLLTLQRFLLDRFVTALPYRAATAPPPFQDANATKEMVESTLKNLPSAFFAKEWKEKQMDTSAGRELLYEEMGKVWDNAGRNMGYMRLFKG